MTRKTLLALAFGSAALISAIPIASASNLGGPSTIDAAGVHSVQYYGHGYGYRDNGYYGESREYRPQYYRHREYDEDDYYYRRPYRRGY